MKRALLAAAIALPLASARLAADDKSDLEEVFRQVDLKSEEVKDLKATFTQTKKKKIRKRPLLASGTISVKKAKGGPRVCWESWLVNEDTGGKSDPQRLLLLGDENLMVSILVDDRTAERTDLGKGKFEVGEILTIGGSLSGMRKSFEAALKERPKDGKGWILSFTPTGDRLKRFIKELDLEIDPRTWLVTRLTMTDPGGDTTEIALSEFRVNEGVDDALFKIPEGTKVTEVDPTGGR